MSYIVDFIKSNKNWRDLLIEKKITVKENDNLALFEYSIESDFTDPVVQEARGIIIDLNTLKVVCWPFRKFGNWNESYVDEIDWSSARVQEKIDGSIIKLWYYNNKWNWSTNGSIYAKDAKVNTIHTFQDLILRANNYKNIKFDKLNKNYTYIFELVSPENQVVIKYKDYKLYHLGTRDNTTGQEYDININIDKPKTYGLDSIGACLSTVDCLNGRTVEYEGFVVVDKDYHRIKVKTPEYVAFHYARNNGNLSKKRAIELIQSNMDLDDIYEVFPDFKHVVLYYQYKISEFYFEVNLFMNITRNFYEEFNHDRKLVANIIKDHKYASFGFRAIGNELKAENLDINLEKYIEDYVEFDPMKDLVQKMSY